MSMIIKRVAAKGIRVTEASNGLGVPYVESPKGIAATFTASGGMPVRTTTPLGPVLNGNFAADTVWDKTGGFIISGGKANHPPGVYGTLQQPIANIVPGRSYTLSYTISNRTVGVALGGLVGGTAVYGAPIGANQVVSQTIVAGAGNTTLSIEVQNTFDGSIDDVSLVGA